MYNKKILKLNNFYRLNKKLCTFFVLKLHADKNFRNIKKNINFLITESDSSSKKFFDNLDFYDNNNVRISYDGLSGHQFNITNYYEIRKIVDFVMKNKILHFNIIEIRKSPFFIKSIKFKKF